MTALLGINCELYHVAFLVADLDEALPAFGSSVGHTFNAATTATMRTSAGFGADDGEIATFRVAYSTGGPLHVEVIEQTDAGVFGREQPLGFHHAGYWVHDLDEHVAALQAAGHTVETTIRTLSGGLLAVFVAPQGQSGVRLELVSTRYRKRLEAWFNAA